jgi:hypothetical protein
MAQNAIVIKHTTSECVCHKPFISKCEIHINVKIFSSYLKVNILRLRKKDQR